jgi:hypothetical protein
MIADADADADAEERCTACNRRRGKKRETLEVSGNANGTDERGSKIE